MSRFFRHAALIARGVLPSAAPAFAGEVSTHLSFAGGAEYSPQVYRSPVTGECTVVVLQKTELKQGRVGNAVSTMRVPG